MLPALRPFCADEEPLLLQRRPPPLPPPPLLMPLRDEDEDEPFLPLRLRARVWFCLRRWRSAATDCRTTSPAMAAAPTASSALIWHRHGTDTEGGGCKGGKGVL